MPDERFAHDNSYTMSNCQLLRRYDFHEDLEKALAGRHTERLSMTDFPGYGVLLKSSCSIIHDTLLIVNC